MLWRHALRNAMIPVLTIIGLQFAFLLAGTIIIENVFYLPGLGRLVFQAITQRDLIVVEGVVMLLVATVIVVNLLVDLSYAHRRPAPEDRPMSPPPRSAGGRRRLPRPGLRQPLLRHRLRHHRDRRRHGAGVVLLDALRRHQADRRRPHAAALRRRIWLGTDHFGRDMLSMIMVGARNSIAVALVAVGIGMGIGVPLGCWAAARGGIVDEALMRFNDLVFAFPALLSAIMITAIFGPGAVNAIIAIGIFNIPVFARVSRAGALSLWPREFILAARAAGKGKALITVEHILPNIANLLLVQGTIQFALGILAEAGLSYVGLGAQPPMPSWGRMLFDAQTRMIVAPYLAIFPGMAIVVTVLGLNLLGDGISDMLDPKLRRRR